MGSMARKGKVHKGLRAARDNARLSEKPANLLEPTRKLSSQDLELQRSRARSAGTKGKSARTNREREFARRDKSQQW